MTPFLISLHHIGTPEDAQPTSTHREETILAVAITTLTFLLLLIVCAAIFVVCLTRTGSDVRQKMFSCFQSTPPHTGSAYQNEAYANTQQTTPTTPQSGNY